MSPLDFLLKIWYNIRVKKKVGGFILKILIISGKAGSGKSFVAEHVKAVYEKIYGWRVATIAYGDPLKMVARNIYGWDGAKGPNGRALLQTLGTDIVQKNNQYCWVNCVIEIIKGLESEFDLFIISDARFPHEVDYMKETLPANYDIITLRIEGKTSLEGDTAQHLSETGLDDYEFDYHFPNRDYDITVFFSNLFTLIHRLNQGLED